MMKVEVLKNVILLWFFRKFSKSRYDKKIEEKTVEKLSKKEKTELIMKIEYEMKEAAKRFDFEKAIELRDILFEIKSK